MPTSKKKILKLLDGGLGTTLKDDFNVQCDGVLHPLWSSHLLISSPDTLLEAQTRFVDTGAQILLTATYQASFEGFARTRTPERYAETGVSRKEASEFMRSAVFIAKNAYGSMKGEIALSLGAYGAVMVPSQEYTGAYDAEHANADSLGAWHKERLDVFVSRPETWKQIDMVAYETIPRVDEVSAVRAIMSDLGGRSKPYWISCVFPNEDDCLPDGTSIDELVRVMLSTRHDESLPFAIGLNCTKLHKVERIVRKFEAAIRHLQLEEENVQWPSLVVYPDGTRGEVYNTTTCEWEKKNTDNLILVRALKLYQCCLHELTQVPATLARGDS